MSARNRLCISFLITCGLALLSTVGAANTEGTSINFMRVPDSGIQPQIVEKDGVIHLLYFTGDAQKGDLNYVVSRDYGRKFSKPIRVNSEAGTAMATGNIRGGHLAIGANGRVHVAWIGSSLASPGPHQILHRYCTHASAIPKIILKHRSI
jgi:hypothetical protein